MIQIAEEIKVEENLSQKAVETIAQCAKVTAQAEISKAEFDKTFTKCAVKEVLTEPPNSYKIRVDNADRIITCAGTDFAVGETVDITLPKNNWDNVRVDVTYALKPYKVTFGQTSIIVIFSDYVNHKKDITKVFPVTRDVNGNIQKLTYPNGNICEVTW